MKRRSLIAVAAAAATFAALPLVAADKNKEKDDAVPSATLGQFTLGEVVNKVPFKKEDLDGKPVVLEFWGINCPPCIAFLPELAKMHRRYDTKGLQIVGIHAQNGTDEAINKILDKAKVKYPVLRTGTSPINFSGIPRAFVFDKDGKLAWTGNPHDDGFEKAVRKVTK
jgi:thiol-disulfide isomerase/thioredoxin